MSWNTYRHALTPALGLQAVVIVGGTLITSGMMKLHGYPDAADTTWNPVSEWVRSWGWLAVVIPAVWFVIAWRSSSKSGDDEVGLAQGVVAAVGVLLLLGFYFWTATTAAEVRVRFVPLDSLGAVDGVLRSAMMFWKGGA